MKCWVGKRACEWKKILVFVILILCSIVACELALEYRKTLGMVSVKDYIITYNYRVVPYIPIPVILFFLISHIRRMYDDNKMVRYVNIRKFYLDVIENGIHNLILYVFIMACMVFVGGIISTHGVVDNWNSKEAMAQRLYGNGNNAETVTETVWKLSCGYKFYDYIHRSICYISSCDNHRLRNVNDIIQMYT